ncbi:translation initiation factor [Reichenbachiella sp. MALMAid0571]|uniref:translation initiation factor n=1 Tax=Reichenbachiella sp. MALMAid0571 TaxID=3143939 RepID=UPI0032DF89E3
MAKKSNSFKNRIGVVYSTDDSFSYDENEEQEEETLMNNQQHLKVMLDKKNRGGKKVTLVSGFVGLTKDINELGKALKNKCGVGGNVKDREILIQGDHRQKVGEILKKDGYQVKVL